MMILRKYQPALLLMALILAGCGSMAPEETATDIIFNTQESFNGQTVQEAQSASRDSAAGENTDEELNFYYAYSALKTEEERQLYREMLASLQNQEKETELSTLDIQLLDPVFTAVMADHPEIFYADGYSSTTWKLGSELKKITFSGAYTMDGETVRVKRDRIEAVMEECFASLPDGADDYETAKYLYEWLIGHTEYRLNSPDNQNISSVFLNGVSVCQGYAKALQLMYQRQGIPALLVTGRINGEGHAWNLVRLDGEWYYTDPTWGDAAWLMDGESMPKASSYPSINYNYFCVTTEQLLRTHTIDSGQELPECTAVTDNYYRREGRYLTSADLTKIGGIFEQAAERGEETVTFQCADEETYREVYRLLIREQKVFSFLPDAGGKVTYADSEKLLTLSFWL